jgi:DNA-binding Lrp family transcriptional regulator
MLTERDLAILEMLEEDARVPPAEIAVRLGIQEAEVRAAIANMEKDRVIVKYKAKVNWEKADEHRLFAFIDVRVTPERNRGFDAVARRLHRFPEVHSLYLMSGDHDLTVVVQGRSLKEIAAFVSEKLAPLEGVQGTATHFVLKVYKDDGDILLEEEEDRRLAITP